MSRQVSKKDCKMYNAMRGSWEFFSALYKGGRRGGFKFTRNDPHASHALLASDAVLQHARRGGLDAAPVRGDAGDGDLPCRVGVKEEGDARGACEQART